MARSALGTRAYMDVLAAGPVFEYRMAPAAMEKLTLGTSSVTSARGRCPDPP
jgi:hypothetical protein